MRFIATAVLILLTFTAFGQLTKAELQILKNVEKNYEESVAFLEKTVNINSGTYNIAGVKKVGLIYKEFLDQLGFTTKWVDMPAELKRAGHLVGEIKGKKGKRLLLIGHIDTVFEPESDFQKWNRKDSLAWGPGVNDMKGGNMVLLYALKAMHEAGMLKDRQVIVILHGDEEAAGRPLDISRKDIIEAAQRSDIALCFETGTGFNYATVARRGSSNWHLEVTGKQGHSSGIFTPNAGAGAVYEAARILTRFYSDLQEQYLTYNPGIILGGTQLSTDSTGTEGDVSGKTNIIANTAVVNGDLRFISEEQKQKTREKMKAIVSESLPGTKSVITFNDGYPSMPPTDGNMEVLNRLSKVNMDMGLGEVKPYDPGRRGAGDISFIAEYLDCLDGLGAMGGNAHAPGEFINLNSLQNIEKRVALLCYRITNEKISATSPR
ncbi:MAG TPA: M20/M25/M40 family metallo-hydrolase [Cyclobacteriaceae bacterium]|nr:M20/M25/M40 family metallo-hydrolase [Cyclobacteriaceae bacterium]